MLWTNWRNWTINTIRWNLNNNQKWLFDHRRQLKFRLNMNRNNQNLKLINRSLLKYNKLNQINLIPYQKYLSKRNKKRTWLKYSANPHILTHKCLRNDPIPSAHASSKVRRGTYGLPRSLTPHRRSNNRRRSEKPFNQVSRTSNRSAKSRYRNRPEATVARPIPVPHLLVHFLQGPSTPKKRMK